MHTVKYAGNYKRLLACLNHPAQYLNESKVQGNQMLIREGKAIPFYTKEEVLALLLKLKNVFQVAQHIEVDDNERPVINVNERANTFNQEPNPQSNLWE